MCSKPRVHSLQFRHQNEKEQTRTMGYLEDSGCGFPLRLGMAWCAYSLGETAVAAHMDVMVATDTGVTVCTM